MKACKALTETQLEDESLHVTMTLFEYRRRQDFTGYRAKGHPVRTIGQSVENPRIALRMWTDERQARFRLGKGARPGICNLHLYVRE